MKNDLAGLRAQSEPRSPVIGARRCRVTKPLTVPATHRGRWGSAWRVDLNQVRRKQRVGAGAVRDATVAHWIIEAPWSSEVVHSYSLVCVHLRFELPLAPVVRYVEGATHEVALLAIHPQVDRIHMLREPVRMDSWLRPAVFAAQIIVGDDATAINRCGHAVDLVCAGRLSPHPTHARDWAELFGDNMMRAAEGGRSDD